MFQKKQPKILALLLIAGFVFALSGLARQASETTAKDPVCGMSVTKAGAKFTYDFKGTTYYFCNEGCKTEFIKNPEKYLAKIPAPTAGQHMKMKHEEASGCCMEGCMSMMKEAEVKVENTKDGVIITLTSKNAETVKKIQEHAEKMKEGQCCKMNKDGEAGAITKGKEGCPMGKGCPNKEKK